MEYLALRDNAPKVGIYLLVCILLLALVWYSNRDTECSEEARRASIVEYPDSKYPEYGERWLVRERFKIMYEKDCHYGN